MLADIVDVTKDVVVPKAQDGPTILFQTRCPRFVGDNGISFRMLAAVDFDDEFLLWTREVDDVVGDRNLPPEAKPISRCARSSFQSFNSADVMTLRIDLAFARCLGGKDV